MTISGVWGANSQDWQAIMQERKQDMEQLGADLQGGNLSAAQVAFTDLQSTNATNQSQSASPTSAASSTSGSSTTATSAQSTVAGALTSLSQALQSGNLSDAQSAFSQLQNDLQARGAGGHHHHHGGGGGKGTGGSQIASDFSTLGQALQSGSLPDAQSAFDQIQSDFQNLIANRQGGTYSSTGSTSASSTSSSSVTTVALSV